MTSPGFSLAPLAPLASSEGRWTWDASADVGPAIRNALRSTRRGTDASELLRSCSIGTWNAWCTMRRSSDATKAPRGRSIVIWNAWRSIGRRSRFGAGDGGRSFVVWNAGCTNRESAGCPNIAGAARVAT